MELGAHWSLDSTLCTGQTASVCTNLSPEVLHYLTLKGSPGVRIRMQSTNNISRRWTTWANSSTGAPPAKVQHPPIHDVQPYAGFCSSLQVVPRREKAGLTPWLCHPTPEPARYIKMRAPCGALSCRLLQRRRGKWLQLSGLGPRDALTAPS